MHQVYRVYKSNNEEKVKFRKNDSGGVKRGLPQRVELAKFLQDASRRYGVHQNGILNKRLAVVDNQCRIFGRSRNGGISEQREAVRLLLLFR